MTVTYVVKFLFLIYLTVQQIWDMETDFDGILQHLVMTIVIVMPPTGRFENVFVCLAYNTDCIVCGPWISRIDWKMLENYFICVLCIPVHNVMLTYKSCFALSLSYWFWVLMQNCIIMGACIINYDDFLKCESWELITAVMEIILIMHSWSADSEMEDVVYGTNGTICLRMTHFIMLPEGTIN